MMNLKATENRKNLGSFKLAHELRNPLTNVMLSCEHLKEQISKGIIEKDHLINCLEIIERSCDRMSQLIYALTQQDKNVKEGNKSIGQILEESLILAADRINLKKITVEKSLHIIISVLSTDVEKLRTAFLNIIINAVEAMDPGKGVLQIIAIEDIHSFSIKFSDNGVGIQKSDQQKLFEPYFTNKKNGLGIGLTITKEILAELNATIQVQSEPGEGASFIVKFSKENFLINLE